MWHSRPGRCEPRHFYYRDVQLMLLPSPDLSGEHPHKGLRQVRHIRGADGGIGGRHDRCLIVGLEERILQMDNYFGER